MRTALVLALALAGARPASAAPPITNVERAVAFLRANRPRGSAVPPRYAGARRECLLDERAINEYLAHWLETEANKKSKDVVFRSASVRLMPGRVVAADAVVQLGLGAAKVLEGRPTLARMLSLDNAIHAEVFVTSAKGKIFCKIVGLRLKGLPVPDGLVQDVLRLVGQKQRPPIDFTRLFPLPNGIEKIEVLPQSLRVQVREA